MKKRDFILIGAVLAVALLCWLIPRGLGIFAGAEIKLLKEVSGLSEEEIKTLRKEIE